ncbi:MAG TPA: translocation/assembly module TamB domain-containing protein [Candidatus Binatia bacterium]|nr:translocation/assembly module TamB domain-containing protein [Candidatus Binatia bacterium]
MRTRLTIGLLAGTILLSLVVAKRHEVLRLAIEGAGLAAGYSVRIGEQHVAWDAAEFLDLRVARGGEPLLFARRITLRYSPRDLLPASRHRFGLLAIEAIGAKVTLTRFRDGSFNFNVPRAGPPGPPQRPNGVPLRFSMRVRDAQIELREPTAYDPSAKDLRVRDINADGSIDSVAVTRYRARGVVIEQSPEPFTIAGRVDTMAGYAVHHARAPRFPMRALANYFAETPAVRVLGGTARNFDARIYALGVTPGAAPDYHVSLSLDVDNGRLALQSLAAPVEGIVARLDVVDNAFFVRDARATLAGIPLHFTGGTYDFTGGLTGRAELNIGVWGAGDLSGLRQAFAFARDQEISGHARLGVLVHGPIDDPVIVARVEAPHARYRTLPFEALSAGVVYNSNVVALSPLSVRYGGVALHLDGTLGLGRHLMSRFAVQVTGSASRLPYLDEMLGDEPILIDASATGTDLLFRVTGSAASARGVDRVASIVRMGPDGTANVDPFWFHTQRGDLDGGYILDRPHDTSAFWLIAGGLRMRAPRFQAFPGLSLPQIPPIDSRSVGMTVAGGGSGKDIVLAGLVNGSDASIAGVKFDRIDAAFGGNLQNASVNLLRATGPWGTFDGHGQFSSARFAAYGAYRGTFDGLQPFLGSAIPGHGALAGTVGVGIEPQRIVVVGSNLRMRGATLRGIPIERASLTLAVEGNRLRIYSASARAAGGDVVAAGVFPLAAPGAGRPQALSLVAKRLDAAQLHGIGLPIDRGTLSAAGNLGAGSPIPTFDGAVTIENGRIARFAISGNGDITLHGNEVGLHRVLGSLGTTYARVDGSIGALTSGSPAYALDADVPAARIAPALHSFGIPNYMTDGSFNARLHVGGRSVAPAVAGRVAVPAAEVNGLPFVDGSATLAADPAGVTIRNAAVLVGTTAAHFNAVVRPGINAIDVDAPRADLSDFNNFFDTGDTLDGSGSVKLAASSRNARISSSGDINVSGFRYRNLSVGDTKAVWSSERNAITGTVAVGGGEGTLRARGSIAVTPGAQWQSTLAQSRFDLTGDVNDLDLSFWIPALGLQGVPITGRASGEASVHGRFPEIALRTSARVESGTIGPLTLDSADVALHSAGRRILIDRAQLTTPELSASAAGSLSLEPSEPLDVRVHAATDDLAQLVYNVARLRVPLRGAFESTLKIGGTYRSPTFLAGFDGSDVVAYGIPIASLFGEVRLHRNALVLSDAGATFVRGQATLAGSLPLQLAPLRLAAADQPISFDLDVVGLDPAVFDAALGQNTKLGGTVDGHIGLSGTVRQPVIVGRVGLANGSYVSDLERVSITRMAGALTFNHTTASIERAYAQLGGGTLTGSGTVEFPSGFGSGDATFSMKAAARGAQLDLPAYGRGTLDAAIALNKRAHANALLSGNVTLSNAVLPFAAFLKAAQQSGAIAKTPIPLAFDLTAAAGKNVRVRGSGYGAGLDIGVAGSVKLAGTLAAPTLAGSFDSTGGTLTYFDRAFRVQQGSVSFNAADGVLPNLKAVATTTVVNPDPDRARNPYGSANITINVEGPIAGLKIALTSNPPGYTQDQILGLIAPFGGFFNGIDYSRQGMLARQQPNGITPLGTLSPIPNVNLQQRSTITVGQEAFNLLNAQFTAGLLAPMETSLGQGLGLSSINLTLGYYGNVGVTATRLLGKTVSAVYAVTFGLPQIQSFGLVAQPNPETSTTLNFYLQSGPQKLLQLPSTPVGYSAAYLTTQPLVGNTGFSLTYQRYFW